MSPIQIYNDAILVSDGKIAVDPACCCTDFPLIEYPCCAEERPSAWTVTASGITVNPDLAPADLFFWNKFKELTEGVPFLCEYRGGCLGSVLYFVQSFKSSTSFMFSDDPRIGPSGPVYLFGYVYDCHVESTQIEFGGGIGTTNLSAVPDCPGRIFGDMRHAETRPAASGPGVPLRPCPNGAIASKTGTAFSPLLAYTLTIEPA